MTVRPGRRLWWGGNSIVLGGRPMRGSERCGEVRKKKNLNGEVNRSPRLAVLVNTRHNSITIHQKLYQRRNKSRTSPTVYVYSQSCCTFILAYFIYQRSREIFSAVQCSAVRGWGQDLTLPFQRHNVDAQLASVFGQLRQNKILS